MNTEKQKSKLLDEFIVELKSKINTDAFVNTASLLDLNVKLLRDYQWINIQLKPTEPTDPIQVLKDGAEWIRSQKLQRGKSVIQNYESIGTIPFNSPNPYIDEVFSGRLYNWLMDYTAGNGIVPRLSECPHIDELKNQRGIGMKSLMDYRDIMRKYGIEWKN